MVRDDTMSGTCALPQKQICVVPLTICDVTTSGTFFYSCWHLHLFLFLLNKVRGWYFFLLCIEINQSTLLRGTPLHHIRNAEVQVPTSEMSDIES
jgi:hypothetical protein